MIHRQIFYGPGGNSMFINEHGHIFYEKGYDPYNTTHNASTGFQLRMVNYQLLSYVSLLQVHGGAACLVAMPHFSRYNAHLRCIQFIIPLHHQADDDQREYRHTFALNTLFEWCIFDTHQLDHIFITTCCETHVEYWKRIIMIGPSDLHHRLVSVCLQQSDIDDPGVQECDLTKLDNNFRVDTPMALPNLKKYVDHFSSDIDNGDDARLIDRVFETSKNLEILDLVCGTRDSVICNNLLHTLTQLTQLTIRTGIRLNRDAVRSLFYAIPMMPNMTRFEFEFNIQESLLKYEDEYHHPPQQQFQQYTLPFWTPEANKCLSYVKLKYEGAHFNMDLHRLVSLLKRHLIGSAQWESWKTLELIVDFHPSFQCKPYNGVVIDVIHQFTLQQEDGVQFTDVVLPIENYKSLMD